MPVVQRTLALRKASATIEVITSVRIPSVCCNRHPRAFNADKARKSIYSCDEKPFLEAYKEDPLVEYYHTKRRYSSPKETVLLYEALYIILTDNGK